MTKIRELFENKKGNAVIYILLAVGILMLVMASSPSAPPESEVSSSLGDTLALETERLLSGIEGVGRAEVMISYSEAKSSGELTFDSHGGEKKPESVLVVADGGENQAVREKIVRAVRAATGVSPHKIEVFERKEEQ